MSKAFTSFNYCPFLWWWRSSASIQFLPTKGCLRGTLCVLRFPKMNNFTCKVLLLLSYLILSFHAKVIFLRNLKTYVAPSVILGALKWILVIPRKRKFPLSWPHVTTLNRNLGPTLSPLDSHTTLIPQRAPFSVLIS